MRQHTSRRRLLADLEGLADLSLNDLRQVAVVLLARRRAEPCPLDALRQGVTIDGIRYGAIEATVDRLQGSNSWLTFAIREGKNREVKNVLGHLGLAVNRLIRVSFGPFQLGDLAEGAIEEVRTRTLRDQLGERVAALAGADFSGPRMEREAPPAGTPHRSHEARPAHGEMERKRAPQQRRRDSERMGEPERARREKRRSFKPRGKRN